MGSAGPVGLSDPAICSAMKHYFTIKKRDLLPISIAVRRFAGKVLAHHNSKRKKNG